MLAQKMIWFLKRMIFYMLLVPFMVGLTYTLANQLWTPALVFLVLSLAVLYKGLIRIVVPANSVVVRDGTVVFYIPERTVRDRFDFYSRSQTIVELPHFNLLDRPYRVEIIAPDAAGGLTACRLVLTLAYIPELSGYQRVYDHYIRYQDKFSLLAKRELYRSAGSIVLPPGLPGEGERDAWLEPVLAQLEGGLAPLGLKIAEASCSFSSGSTLVRIVAGEQETVEKED